MAGAWRGEGGPEAALDSRAHRPRAQPAGHGRRALEEDPPPLTAKSA